VDECFDGPVLKKEGLTPRIVHLPEDHYHVDIRKQGRFAPIETACDKSKQGIGILLLQDVEGDIARGPAMQNRRSRWFYFGIAHPYVIGARKPASLI